MMSRLTAIKSAKAELSREEAELSAPILTDTSLVKVIYDIFVQHTGRTVKRHSTSLDRKMFLFVVLYFFCPAALAGFKIRRGLRDSIAEVLGCTSSNVSHDYRDVGFYYVTYKGFRECVSNIITEASDKLVNG